MHSLAQTIIHLACTKAITITTAESCTGGLLAAALTDIAGASEVFHRGFITYSNHAKIDMLGINKTLIEHHGAVSQAIACAMAEGALKHANAQLSASITGIAGPSGGSTEKPVGTVHLAVSIMQHGELFTHHQHHLFQGDRTLIRQQSVHATLQLIFTCLDHL